MEPFELPDDNVFRTAAAEFRLPVLDTIYAFQDLAARHKDDQEHGHRKFLKDAIEYVKGFCGVELGYGEADALNDELTRLHVLAKKKRADALLATQQSASSTASTPEDGAERN